MTTPINLNKARKAHERVLKKAKADTNVARFGRTKAERLLEAAQAQRAEMRLDQQKFEDE